MATIGERPVTPEPAAADALEKPAKQVDVTAPLRPAAACLRGADLLDSSPRRIRIDLVNFVLRHRPATWPELLIGGLVGWTVGGGCKKDDD